MIRGQSLQVDEFAGLNKKLTRDRVTFPLADIKVVDQQNTMIYDCREEKGA